MVEDNFHILLNEQVHQATGIVGEQLHCSMLEALSRLIIRAKATGQTLDVTALDVIDGVIRFDP